MKVIKIYTDGGYRSNFEVGSYAYIILSDNKVVREFSNAVTGNTDSGVTNNTMELQSVISALKWLKSNGYSPGSINIYLWTDSQYVQLGLNRWITAWKRNAWRTANKKPVKNQKLWIELDKLRNEFISLNLQWVEGHNGDEWNEKADKLCGQAMDEYVIKSS